ncbi:MAG: hypothetical protein CM15mP68_4460 [Pseudomonadota bacterium]|nr:MAG: hypothetical protein CM15mP68_4460 [Pseudomonadota bacterium]
MHAVGARQSFSQRPQINAQRFGHDSRNFLLENNFLPPEMESAYASVSEHLLQRILRFYRMHQISAFMATATWVTFYGATRYRTLLTSTIA